MLWWRRSSVKLLFLKDGLRCAATFVDPFGAKDPRRAELDVSDVERRNRDVGFCATVGDLKTGLADDTSVHSFGDLRINFARLNPHSLCFWWEYDFTGGRILNNGQNALLSSDTKEKIYAQYISDPKEWTVEKLAETYGIRQQRVMAILSLKKLAQDRTNDAETAKYKDAAPPEITFESEEREGEGQEKTRRTISDQEWYRLCDWAENHVFRATAERGAGERHFVSVPTFPRFEEIPLEEAPKYTNTEWSVSKVNRMYTAKEDKFQIREFKERLHLNTGELGKSLDFKTDRRAWHRSPPKDITPLVVTSLDVDMVKPYVAEADGTQRKLTDDEFLIWRRQNREAFTKLVKQQIQRDKTVQTTVEEN